MFFLNFIKFKMYLPRDVKCEIYNKITDASSIVNFINSYNKSKSNYKETKDAKEAKNYLELKSALECIKRIDNLNKEQAEIVRSNYDLFPNLEYTTGVPLSFYGNEIYKYEGRPLRNLGLLL